MHSPSSSSADAGFERGYLRVGSYQLHFTAAGQGERALFLFHETPMSGAYFAPSMRILSQNFRVIALDTPGYGQSQPPSQPLTVAQYAELLWGAVSKFGHRKVALAGVHTGAALCLQMLGRSAAVGSDATSDGARADSATRGGTAADVGPQSVIVGAVLSGIPLLNAARRQTLQRLLAERQGKNDTSDIFSSWHDRATRWRDAPRELLIRAFADELSVFERRDAALAAVLNYDPRPSLSGCKTPVLLLNGEHDSLADVDIEMAREFPQLRLQILAGRGGQLPWSAADLYCQHLSEYLTSLF